MPIDLLDAASRRERIERMIEQFRFARHRRLVRQAMELWRQTARHEQLARLEAPPERVH
jgi:hypothetical protein